MSGLSLRALDRYRFLLFASLLAVVLGTLAVFSYQTTNVFIDVMRPDFEAKAVLVSDTIAAQFQRASDLNFDVSDLRGLSSFLDDAIDNHPEVAYALVTIPDQGVVYASTKFAKDARISAELRAHLRARQSAERSRSFGNIVDVTTPLPKLGAHRVLLHVGVDEKHIQTRLLEIKIDLLITLFVAVVITLEVLFFVVLLTLDRQRQTINDFLESVSAGVFPLVAAGNRPGSTSPLTHSLQNAIFTVNGRYKALLQRGAAANLATEPRRLLRKMLGNIDEKFQFSAIRKSMEGDVTVIKAIRLPMFIFFFSTDLSRPFWPIFVGGFPPPMAGLDGSFLMALPMAMWALTMMVVTPFGPRLVRMLGVRNSLLAGMAPAAAGTLMCAFSTGYVELVFWRCVTAAGFGIVGVTGILYVTMAAQVGRSARSAAVFIGAQTAAGVCGTALGGILADRLGYPGTLIVSAAIIACNCLLVARIISTVSPARTGGKGTEYEGSVASYGKVLRRWNFVAFIPLAALPPRIVLTGFLLFMTPVVLHKLEYTDAAVGRFMMCYFISNLLFTPLVARVLDRYNCHRALLLVGSALLGGAVLLFAYANLLTSLILSMVLLGLGMALTTTSLISIIPVQFARECASEGHGTVTSLLRVVERVGSILGPLFVAFLIRVAGFSDGAMFLGAILTAIAIGLALYFYLTRSEYSRIEKQALQ